MNICIGFVYLLHQNILLVNMNFVNLIVYAQFYIGTYHMNNVYLCAADNYHT